MTDEALDLQVAIDRLRLELIRLQDEADDLTDRVRALVGLPDA